MTDATDRQNKLIDQRNIIRTKGVRIFFAWTPLQILMATAAAYTLPETHLVFIWAGPKKVAWKELMSKCSVWDDVIDFSKWGQIGFWEYIKHYDNIYRDLQELFTKKLANYDIQEVAIASDDEYLSLILFRAYKETFNKSLWKRVSLLEDGMGLYLRTNHDLFVRHLTKLGISILLRKRIQPLTLKYFSTNPLIRKIYATSPKSVPQQQEKQIINISSEFKEVILTFSESINGVSPLPLGSGLILSETFSPTAGSIQEEKRLINDMVAFLKKRCRNENIFVKYHHYDPPYKREIFRSYGVKELICPSVPYELLHPHLKPEYLISYWSSALVYSFMLGYPGQFVAFCGSYGNCRRSLYRRTAEFYSHHGIEVI